MANRAAQQLGRKGGKSTSEAKRAASAENGKRGGRPIKMTSAFDGVDETLVLKRWDRQSEQDERTLYIIESTADNICHGHAWRKTDGRWDEYGTCHPDDVNG